MKARKARAVAWVTQVRVEAREVGAARERLVDNGVRRQRREEELRKAAVRGLGARELLGRVQQAVEGHVRAAVVRTPHNRLPHGRHGTQRLRAKRACVDGDVPEGRHLQVHETERLLKHLQRLALGLHFKRHEKHGHRHRALLVAQELKRDVRHDARAVAGNLVRAARPAVFHAAKRTQRGLQVLMAAHRSAAGQDAHATRGVLSSLVTQLQRATSGPRTRTAV